METHFSRNTFTRLTLVKIIYIILHMGRRAKVYKRKGNSGWMHLNFGGGKGSWSAIGEYYYLPDIDGEQFRDNGTWQAWCLENMERKEEE